MAVFRIEKNKNYTSMANYHFYDKSLSWKAKGILSNMLSLPDDWDYSLAGLATLSSDGISATRSAIKELEEHRYLIRRPIRKDGKIYDWEYLIFEKPQEENLLVENQQVENQTQLNTKELNTNKSNTKELNTNDIVELQKRKRFVPPTLEEVKSYCLERNNNVDAERFIDYYTSNGWMVGKNKMKDWKAAVRTWEKSGYNNIKKTETNQPKQKEFNFIPTGIAESGEEYMEIDGKWFNRYGKELNSKGYEIIDFGLSKGW